jgi:hypothetical protein
VVVVRSRLGLNDPPLDVVAIAPGRLGANDPFGRVVVAGILGLVVVVGATDLEGAKEPIGALVVTFGLLVANELPGVVVVVRGVVVVLGENELLGRVVTLGVLGANDGLDGLLFEGLGLEKDRGALYEGLGLL